MLIKRRGTLQSHWHLRDGRVICLLADYKLKKKKTIPGYCFSGNDAPSLISLMIIKITGRITDKITEIIWWTDACELPVAIWGALHSRMLCAGLLLFVHFINMIQGKFCFVFPESHAVQWAQENRRWQHFRRICSHISLWGVYFSLSYYSLWDSCFSFSVNILEIKYNISIREYRTQD